MIWIALACFALAFFARNSLVSGPLMAVGFTLTVIWFAQPAQSAQRHDWLYFTWGYPDKPQVVRGFGTKETCEYTRRHDQRVPTSSCYQEIR